MTRVARTNQGRILSLPRIAACAVAGVLAGTLAGLVGPVQEAPLVGWIVAAGSAVVWVWWISWPQGYELTEKLAEEDGGSRSTDALVLVGACASLAAIGFALFQSSSDRGLYGVLAVVLAMGAAVTSWVLVNTVFALKYARLYYFDIDDGGIDFHQQEPPTYSDFAFYAFSIGMAFAPAEVTPTNSLVRKVCLWHALLSYPFGTVIIAVSVNLVANIAQH